MRLTNMITANITQQLFEQLHAHSTAHRISTATLIRCALRHYLDHADTIAHPENLRSIHTQDNLNQIQRIRTVGFAINPNRDPDLRDRLEIYAMSNKLTLSTVLRRATYEYTKPTDPHTQPDPIATIEAWGDNYKTENQLNGMPIRLVVHTKP